ncbi:WXG100-like domain-containing protein [Nocardia sp. NPDC003693]
MTDFNVDPNVYATAAAALNSAATDFHAAFQGQMTALSDTVDMGGTVGACGEWAKSYDSVAWDAYSLASSLVQAIDNYAGILQQAGYNYALADYRAGTGRPEPAAPVAFPMAWSTCPIPPPSAGGAGSGLADDGFELAAAAGVPIPDGDPDKLIKAAAAWNALATHDSVANLAAELEAVAKNFEAVTAPEAAFIDEDLREMKAAAETVCATFGDVSQSCRDQKTAVDDLRTQLKALLTDLAADIAKEVAVSLVFSAVAGVLTAGFGAAAVAAYRVGKIALKVKSYAGKIAGIVGKAKLLDKVHIKSPVATTREKLQRIVDLVKKHGDDLKRVAPKQWDELFANGRKPKASELEDYAKSRGWTKTQTENGPPKYTDENGVTRLTIKKGSDRAEGSETPHVEIRNEDGRRIDPFGNEVTRRSPGNHTDIEWDW